MCPAIHQLNGFIAPQIEHAVVSGIAVDLQDAAKALQYVSRVFACRPGRIGKGNARWFWPVPGAIITGECPEIVLFDFAPTGIKDWGRRFISYPAGDCIAICRQGINSFEDPLRCASSASWTGFSSRAALPTQNAKMERSMSTLCRA